MFSAFREQGRNCSEQFLYWDNFLTQIFPVICDLTHSHRESNRELHLSAIRRALLLCFELDSVNYKRWLPLYYEDVVTLKERFPNIHARFSIDYFTIKHTRRVVSAFPVDQGLEKAYNKPAKGPSGVVEITKRKEAILKWNILKHMKMKYNDGTEYFIHLEFSTSETALDELQVQQDFPVSADMEIPLI